MRQRRAQKPEPKDSPEEQVAQCGVAIQQALQKYNCQMWPALKIGNAEPVIGDVAGFPIIIKIGSNAHS